MTSEVSSALYTLQIRTSLKKINELIIDKLRELTCYQDRYFTVSTNEIIRMRQFNNEATTLKRIKRR